MTKSISSVLAAALLAVGALCASLWYKARSLAVENHALRASAEMSTEVDTLKRELARLRLEIAELRARVSPQYNVQPALATGQQSGTTDPLAFYRRNPELMKRYFPHLVNAPAPQPQAEEPKETPPDFDPE
jgi:hypothetical protein